MNDTIEKNVLFGEDQTENSNSEIKNSLARAGLEKYQNNLDLIINWKNITSLIPQFYLDNKMKKAGIAGIFAASLELTKEGVVSVSQSKIFDKTTFESLSKNIMSTNRPLHIPGRRFVLTKNKILESEKSLEYLSGKLGEAKLSMDNAKMLQKFLP